MVFGVLGRERVGRFGREVKLVVYEIVLQEFSTLCNFPRHGDRYISVPIAKHGCSMSLVNTG